MSQSKYPSSFDYEALLASGRGELFGDGNARLPAPPMLMLDRIVMSGGIATLNWIGQGLADLTGLPVNRPHSLEATARGVAQLLAQPDTRWICSSVTHFTPQNNIALSHRYTRWRQALENYVGGGSTPR